MANNCNFCSKQIKPHQSKILCNICNLNYHSHCVYTDVNTIEEWYCFQCTGKMFPFNHYLDDDEFKFGLFTLNNTLEYNRILYLKFNPFDFNLNNSSNLSDYGTHHTCSYIFDYNITASCEEDFSILHINARSFNKNVEQINTFLTSLSHTFLIIALSETWFKEDDSNLIYIDNYNLVNASRHGRSGGVAIYVHNTVSFRIRNDLILIKEPSEYLDHSEFIFIEVLIPNKKKHNCW